MRGCWHVTLAEAEARIDCWWRQLGLVAFSLYLPGHPAHGTTLTRKPDQTWLAAYLRWAGQQGLEAA